MPMDSRIEKLLRRDENGVPLPLTQDELKKFSRQYGPSAAQSADKEINARRKAAQDTADKREAAAGEREKAKAEAAKSAAEAKGLEAEARDKEEAATAKRQENERVAKKQKSFDDFKDTTAGQIGEAASAFGAPVAGAATGFGLGRAAVAAERAIGKGLNESRNKLAENARGINWADPESAIPAGEGVMSGAGRSAIMPGNSLMSKVGRGAGRLIPQAGLGAGLIAEGFIQRQPQEDDSPVRRLGREAFGTGAVSAGATLAAHGVGSAFFPATAPDANALAAIDEVGARLPMAQNKLLAAQRAASQPPPPPDIPSAPPPAPPPEPHTPMRYGDRLKNAAAAAGGKAGKTKSENTAAIKRGLTPENMPSVADALNLPKDATRPQVMQRLREVSKIGGKLAFPLAVGSYMAATGDSEAADGAMPERAGNAAKNFGIGAGVAYGTNKLLGALPKVAGAIGRMSGPMMLNDIATQAHRGIYGEGPQYLDVPEPSPSRSVVTGQDSGPMENAAALQIPEGIPAPNPDGSSPYAAAEPEDFDTQIADLQRIFAELDQHDAPEPMQQAQQSRQVARMPDPWAQQPQNRLLGAR